MEDESELSAHRIRKLLDSRGQFNTAALNTVLFLNQCSLTKLPDIRDYTNLKCLYLQENRLESMPNLLFLPNLRALHLHSNRITCINLVGLQRLEILDVSHNHIHSIRGISRAEHLTSINLSHNRIEQLSEDDFRELATLKYLTSLDLSSNGMKCANAPGDCSLPSLKNLDISGNSGDIQAIKPGRILFPVLIRFNSCVLKSK